MVETAIGMVEMGEIVLYHLLFYYQRLVAEMTLFVIMQSPLILARDFSM